MVKVELHRVEDPDSLEGFEVEEHGAQAVIAARTELKRRELSIRSVSWSAEKKATLVVYASERGPERPKPRGKPVRHDGPVGRGREIRRRP